jgi:hypothetical protein
MQKQIPRTYEYLFAGGQENSFFFKKDNEIVYEVKFKDTSYLFTNYSNISFEAFELGIIVSENFTEQKPPLDSRIPVTIAAIFYDFIGRNNEQVVIYICDSSDDKQAIRHRKFTQWFESFKGNDFVKINAPITDNRTVVYYTSLIIHRYNPKRQEITEAFINLTDDQQK